MLSVIQIKDKSDDIVTVIPVLNVDFFPPLYINIT